MSLTPGPWARSPRISNGRAAAVPGSNTVSRWPISRTVGPPSSDAAIALERADDRVAELGMGVALDPSAERGQPVGHPASRPRRRRPSCRSRSRRSRVARGRPDRPASRSRPRGAGARAGRSRSSGSRRPVYGRRPEAPCGLTPRPSPARERTPTDPRRCSATCKRFGRLGAVTLSQAGSRILARRCVSSRSGSWMARTSTGSNRPSRSRSRSGDVARGTGFGIPVVTPSCGSAVLCQRAQCLRPSVPSPRGRGGSTHCRAWSVARYRSRSIAAPSQAIGSSPSRGPSTGAPRRSPRQRSGSPMRASIREVGGARRATVAASTGRSPASRPLTPPRRPGSANRTGASRP